MKQWYVINFTVSVQLPAMFLIDIHKEETIAKELKRAKTII